MGEFARVDSIDALKDLRIALCKFGEVVRISLDEAEAEIKRVSVWLRQDQYKYWTAQVRKRTELMNRAKLALKRREEERTPLGGRYSCVDERKALALAKKRLEEAEEKLANVRRWVRDLEREAFTYKAAARGLAETVEAGVPRALATLDNMIVALEAYAGLRPPGEVVSGPSGVEELGGTRRAGEPEPLEQMGQEPSCSTPTTIESQDHQDVGGDEPR